MRIFIVIFLSLFILSCSMNDQESDLPVVVLTFDDCDSTIYGTGFQLMKEYGFSGSNIVNSGRPGKPSYYNWQELQEMNAAGWEVVSHTVNHVNLTEISLEEAKTEILTDIANLRAQGFEPVSFALPSGAVNRDIMGFLSQHFDNVRHSSNTINFSPVDRMNIGYYPMQSSFTPDDMIQRLQIAIYRGECMVVLGFHRFLPDAGNKVDNCKPEYFREILDYISRQGFEVLTLRSALDRFGS